jgi:hypothetical protein
MLPDKLSTVSSAWSAASCPAFTVSTAPPRLSVRFTTRLYCLASRSTVAWSLSTITSIVGDPAARWSAKSALSRARCGP